MSEVIAPGREPLIPAIPKTAIDDPKLRPVVDAMRTIFQTRTSGDQMDQWVTWRNLINNGIVGYQNGQQVVVGGSANFFPVGGTDTNYTAPPAPSNVVITGGFSAIFIEYAGDDYGNHAYTEIWRNTTNSLGTAVLLGTTKARIYVDPVGNAQTYYYWVRFVSTAGVDGPYNSTEGTAGTTSLDPAYVLEVLTGHITTDQLYSDLNSRINLIDGSSSLTNSVSARILAEANARISAINSEASTRAQALLDEASARNAAIATETSARQSAISAEQIARSSAIQAEANTRTQALIDESAARGAAILSEANTRQSADESLSEAVTTLSSSLDTSVATLTAAVSSEVSARSTAVSAEASARDSLAAQIRGSYTGNDAASVTTGLIYSERSSRVTADDALQTQINVLSAASSSDVGELLAAVTEEQTARIAGDNVSASTLSVLTARLDNLKNKSGVNTGKSLEATVVDNQVSQVNADTALTSSLTALSSTVGTNYSTLNAAITSEASTRATDIAAEVSARDTLATQMRGGYTGNDLNSVTSGLIYTERTSRVSGDSSLQSQINILSAATSGNFSDLIAAVSNEATVRANADTAEATLRDALATQMRGSYAGTDVSLVTTGLVYSEKSARASADSALSSSISALSSTVSGNYGTLNAAITSEASTRASADTALASSITSLTANKNRSFKQSSAPTGTAYAVGDIWFDTANSNKTFRWDGAAWVATDDTRISVNSAAITTEQSARITADASLATSITNLTSTVNTNLSTVNAAISSEASTRSTADTALSSQLTTLSSTVTSNNNTLTAALQTESTTRANTDGTLLAQYTVKVDVNGRVAGFGLASTSSGGTPTSSFVVIADKFAVVSPSSTGEVPKIPFVVGTVDGVSAVAMSSAFIQDAAITTAKIGSLQVDDAKIKDGAIKTAKIADAAITTAKIDDAQITSAKIGLLQVGTANIANGAISNAKISDLNATKITAGVISVDRLAANSITADKIDSKGLTIKNAAGAVLFGSGTALDWSLVSGSGKPANNADVTSANIAAGIVGQGTFAKLSQLNNGNISTYMAGAAIGTAQIGVAVIKSAQIDTAQIKTLHIDNQQVTSSAFAGANGYERWFSGSIGGGWNDTYASSAIFANAGDVVLITATFQVDATASYEYGMVFRPILYCDGVEIASTEEPSIESWQENRFGGRKHSLTAVYTVGFSGNHGFALNGYVHGYQSGYTTVALRSIILSAFVGRR